MIYLNRAKRLALRETASWMIGRRKRIRVVGDSMLPTLHAGQFVLLDEQRSPVTGELAVASHPTEPDLLVVKRVGEVSPAGEYHLVSDNIDAGTDSRTWGTFARSEILGTVTLLLDDPSADLSA